MSNKIWAKWVERFWFLRGVGAALAVAALVPQVTDLSRWEFLRAFEALIFGWNNVAEWIGALVGRLPLLPTLSASTVNAIVITSSLIIPGAFALYKMEVMISDDWWFFVILTLGGAVALIRWLALSMPTDLMSLVSMAVVFWILLGSVFIFFPKSNLARPWSIGVLAGFCVVGLVALSIGMPGYWAPMVAGVGLLAAAANLRGYWRGVVFVMTFVAMMQILYWLNTPGLSDIIRDASDAALQEPSTGG